jgi:hypothetical protein
MSNYKNPFEPGGKFYNPRITDGSKVTEPRIMPRWAEQFSPQNTRFGGNAQRLVEKYAIRQYNRFGRQINTRHYNQQFADIYNELQTAPENFHITTDTNRMINSNSEGEFYYDGVEFFIIFNENPDEKYGSDVGAMFEEMYHAKQFLDGKVWFENPTGAGWVPIGGNALIEYEAKKFASTARNYGETYSRIVVSEPPLIVTLSAKTQLKLISVMNQQEGINYLTQGYSYITYDNKTGQPYNLEYPAAYPEYLNTPTNISNRANKQITNSIYAYPYP